jgi:16S rRNA (adenine1518-N6/adenine1519-N6)-dimethyltransferase
VVRPKKHLGQHFLKDLNIARKIVDALPMNSNSVLEVGPGTGVLTQFLIERTSEKSLPTISNSGVTTSPSLSRIAGERGQGVEATKLFLIDVDTESIEYLRKEFSTLGDKIIEGDFLKLSLATLAEGKWSIIGNFPYNISSQIFFKTLEQRHLVTDVVGMVQKEVAQRIASPPGSKEYGILSVLLQAYYDIKLLFSVPPGVFQPPPKVNSAVLSLKRNNVEALPCDEKLFVQVVKIAFQQRRKTLRNALKSLNLPASLQQHELLDKRAERLGVSDFVFLTNALAAR